MDTVSSQPTASAPPLRRAPGDGLIAGVCAGLAQRLRIDPIILRVAFVAASAAGGAGLVLYLLAWAFIPAEGSERAPFARLAGGRRETWMVVAGSMLLLVSALLLLRKWGIWFSDGVVWPVLLAGGGAALIWRQSAAAAPHEAPAPPPRAADAPAAD